MNKFILFAAFMACFATTGTAQPTAASILPNDLRVGETPTEIVFTVQPASETAGTPTITFVADTAIFVDSETPTAVVVSGNTGTCTATAQTSNSGQTIVFTLVDGGSCTIAAGATFTIKITDQIAANGGAPAAVTADCQTSVDNSDVAATGYTTVNACNAKADAAAWAAVGCVVDGTQNGDTVAALGTQSIAPGYKTCTITCPTDGQDFSVAATACDGSSAGDCANGCGTNFYQSAGNSVSNVECTACAIGEIRAANAVVTSTTSCSACTGATPGDCKTGCAANFYQSAGSSASDVVCTACDATYGTRAANADISSTTVCTCSDGRTGAACATPSTPAVSSIAIASTTTIEITFDQNVVYASPQTSEFTVAGIAGGNTIGGISHLNDKVTLTVSNAMTAADAPTVAFGGSNTITNIGGSNNVATWAAGDNTIVNNIAPAIVSTKVASATTIVITYDVNVEATTLTAGDWEVSVAGTAAAATNAVISGAELTLTCATMTASATSNAVTVEYTKSGTAAQNLKAASPGTGVVASDGGPVSATRDTCDASAPPANGGVGTCSGTLNAGATCQPVCDAGYKASGVSTCGFAGTLAAATCSACDGSSAGDCENGCGTNFYQSAGSSASDVECTACAPGTVIAAAVAGSSTTSCSACTGGTAGNCTSGCKANWYQSAGDSAADIVCSACQNGGTIAAAAPKNLTASGAVTCTCTGGYTGADCSTAAVTTTTATPTGTTAKPGLSGVTACQPGLLPTLFVIVAAALSVF